MISNTFSMIRKSDVLIFFVLLLALLSARVAHATHNRAGEITYEQITQFFYKATITTYTKTSSPADRSELPLSWGDGTSSILPRTSFQDNFGGPGSDIRKNIYEGFHTYPGPGTYKMFFEDPNRNGGVINIPNSIQVPFYVETQLTISAFLGFNNSPVLLQPPIDQGTINQVFIHNPNAFDPDGDSLSYELIFCKGAGGFNIPGYTYPNASSSFTLNAVTGDLIWDSPVACGEYNVAFLIKEWRNGTLIGFVERDMQITIICNNPNNNTPPFFTNIADVCVTAGDVVSFNVTATDNDPADVIVLTATGAPLTWPISPAQFNQPATGIGSVTELFTWTTDCDHVRKQPYQVTFKAEDDDPFVSLVDLETVRITVVAPAPQNPTATPVGNSMQVGWDASICPQATGYTIYRRNGFFGFIPGQCETGVPAYTGYVKIASVTGITNTSYLDNNNGNGLAPGFDYCYMIVANFPDGAESYASVEVCESLKKDLPVITNASVTSTSSSTGTMYVAWSKPDELDLAQFPPPHEYRVMRSTGIGTTSFNQVGITFDLNDTTFNDSGLNTVDNGYTYRIDLYATVNGNLELVGSSQRGSSVFLNITETDKRLNLSWNLNVPWTNAWYTVYRFNGATYDSIGFSLTTSFSDSGLVNGQEYCYYIESYGGYSGSGFVDPIINLSQEVCGTPFDNIAPCAPATDSVKYNCLTRELEIEWSIPDTICGSDISLFNVYFSPQEGGPFSVIATIPVTGSYSFYITDDVSVAGCYYITSVDSSGNESAPGPVTCVDNCPFYELPNVFTPDGNNINDLFHPFPYRYIESIDIKIFNRWGLQVFVSKNPDINWNGKTDNTGEDLPDGVYYYICLVNEIYLSGIKTRELKGFVQMLRSSNNFNK
jgi:gliding motility-associated-like protein